MEHDCTPEMVERARVRALERWAAGDVPPGGSSYYHVFEELCAIWGPQCVVETGYYEGWSAEAFERGLARAGVDYRLVSVELEYPLKPHHARVEQWRGDAGVMWQKWDGSPIDLLFIDDDHSFAGAGRAWDGWTPFVRPGGIILVDNMSGKTWPGVRDALLHRKVPFVDLVLDGTDDGTAYVLVPRGG